MLQLADDVDDLPLFEDDGDVVGYLIIVSTSPLRKNKKKELLYIHCTSPFVSRMV